MKKMSLCLVIIVFIFSLFGCINAEQDQLSSASFESAVDQPQVSENTNIESLPESSIPSNSDIQESEPALEDDLPYSGAQSLSSTVQGSVPAEIQFRFVDANGKPVQGIAGGCSLPDGRGSVLFARDGKNGSVKSNSGTDGILCYSTTGYENQTQELLVSVYSAYDSEQRKEYSITFLEEKTFYELVWDLALPQAQPVEQGIVIKVVDADGNPVEGIVFTVVDTFPDSKGDFAPGGGNVGWTSPSDPNGIIVLTPFVRCKSIFTFQSVSFEIEYLTLGALVEKTITID